MHILFKILLFAIFFCAREKELRRILNSKVGEVQ